MGKHRGIDVRVDSYAAQGAARRMCEHKNLRVEFDLPPGKEPFSKNGVIHMSVPSSLMTRDQLTTWWGKLIHETRHNTPRGRQMPTVLKNSGLDPESIQAGILMLAEDSVVDSIGVGEMLGQDETASIYAGHQFDRNINNPKLKNALWEAPKLDEESIAIGTMALTDAFVRQNYQPDMFGRYNDILQNNKLNPEIKKRFEETVTKGWADKLIDLQKEGATATDVYKWTRDWLDDIHNLPPMPPPPPQSGEGDGEGEGAEGQQGQGKGSESPGNNGEGNNKGKGKESGEEGKSEGEDGEIRKQPAKIIFRELERDKHAEVDVDALSDVEGDAELDYDHYYGSKEYKPAEPDQFIEINYVDKRMYTGDGQVFRQGISAWESRHPSTDFNNTKDTLAQEVKRYIQSETRIRVDRNKKKGRIDQRKLYKLGVRDAGRDWQERVFWQKDNKLSVKETSVSLLCDFSGSMGGKKIETAMKCMDQLGNVCEALGINYEMAGFTTGGYHGVFHAIFKPFGHRVQRSQIQLNMSGARSHMSANADGENILYAYHRLLAQQAKRRVMIVLSDGQPASSGGDCCWYLEEVVKGIEQAGLVEIHGIGIMSDAVKEYYSSSSVLRDPSQLETALLTVLKNKVIRIK